MDWTYLPSITSGQNHLARHSERGKKTRQTEEEVGGQHQVMERPGVCQVPEGSEEERKMEESGSEIICGAPTTLEVKGLMMMMMMWQGDLCSPYLYLICAEVLSSMIHNNRNIRGMKLNEKTILLSQFMDDTTLFFFFFFFFFFSMEVMNHLCRPYVHCRNLQRYQD